MTPGHYEVHEAKGFVGDRSPRKGTVGWYWILKAANGETLAMSEIYESKSNAERGVEDAKAAQDDAA